MTTPGEPVTMIRVRRHGRPTVLEVFPASELQERIERAYKAREWADATCRGEQVGRVLKDDDTGRWIYWYSAEVMEWSVEADTRCPPGMIYRMPR